MSEFPETRWSFIHAAQAGDEVALETFALRYRPPVVAFLRSRGLGAEDAEDVTQEVFMRLFRDGALILRATPARGRFRNLLRTIARNAAHNAREHRDAARRGGGNVKLRGDFAEVPTSEDEELFDREWLRHLLSMALEELEKVRPNYGKAIRLTLLRRLSHAEVAQRLDCSTSDVKNYVYRGKKRLGKLLEKDVGIYSTSQEEFELELRWVSAQLGS